MQLILISLALMFFLYGLIMLFKPVKAVNCGKIQYNNCSKIYKNITIALIIILIFVSSFKYAFVDSTAYKNMYENITNPNYFRNSRIEYGWNIYMYLLHFFSSSPYFLFFITYIIIYSIYGYTIFKYGQDNFFFSIFVFIFMFFLPFNNILRQSFAAAIILLSLPFLLKKKIFPYLLIVLIASSFHVTALICVPIYFIANKKPFNFFWISFILITIIFVIFNDSISPILRNAIGDDYYSNYFNEKLSINIVRIIMQACPLVLSIIMYKKNKRNLEIIDIVMINFCLISFCCYLIGVNMVFFSRFALYFDLLCYLSVFRFCDKIFNKYTDWAKLTKWIAFCLYGAYFIFQLIEYYNTGGLDYFYIIFFN